VSVDNVSSLGRDEDDRNVENPEEKKYQSVKKLDGAGRSKRLMASNELYI